MNRQNVIILYLPILSNIVLFSALMCLGLYNIWYNTQIFTNIGSFGHSKQYKNQWIDLQLASNIVFGVDVMLHAFHNRFEKSCSNYYGVCQQLANEKVQLQKEHFNNISFTYLSNIHINFPPRDVESWAFVVKNFNGGTLVDVSIRLFNHSVSKTKE